MLRYVDQRDLDVEENRDSKGKYEEDEDDDEEVEGTPRGGREGEERGRGGKGGTWSSKDLFVHLPKMSYSLR